ncbi:MAG: transketolase [Ancrocorticia sp.]
MTELNWTDLDQRAVDVGRVLAADAVQKVGNGHPGTAISLSPLAYTLFQKVMRHDPTDPNWIGRDRFVLSIGHSSLTLYNQLYLAGYGLELEDIASLRTWGSLTPGHPEYGHTKGVEMTTGPLGQGLASAVGMAMASRRERGLLDPDAPKGESPFDHFVYVVGGEGCLQEGVTSEACSLAGTQHLGNLIFIYDDNRISIEDDTIIAFSEDVLARYESYGWHTQHVDWTNGGSEYVEDVDALHAALEAAKEVTDRPSIIKLSTIMAWPSPTKQGTGAAHGAALGAEEIAGLKKILGLDPEKSFDVADEVIAHTRKQAADNAAAARGAWEADLAQWREANPERSALLDRLVAKELPAGWDEVLPSFEVGKSIATRAASGEVLSALAPVLPELWGGSADLAGSNNTTMKGEPSFLPADRVSADWSGHEYGRTLHFGIREHGMGAIVNGIVLHGLTRAYGGTFFVFADYMRGAVRLAAVMNVPSVFVWTHDSIGVGEDGPTHQPIEHLWAYRAIPGLDIVRPADANETAAAWKGILERREGGPAGIVLSRQNLPVLEGTCSEGVNKGGYVLSDSPTGTVDVQLLATGSEVALAVESQKALAAEGIGARVISLPCLEWFAAQDAEYRNSVILPEVKARVSVEAGSTFGWVQYLGDAGRSVGIDHYGASAGGDKLFAEFGFTVEKVVAASKESIAAA